MSKGFVSKHPWMTFFLAIIGMGTVAEIVKPAPVYGVFQTIPGQPERLVYQSPNKQAIMSYLTDSQSANPDARYVIKSL